MSLNRDCTVCLTRDIPTIRQFSKKYAYKNAYQGRLENLEHRAELLWRTQRRGVKALFDLFQFRMGCQPRWAWFPFLKRWPQSSCFVLPYFFTEECSILLALLCLWSQSSCILSSSNIIIWMAWGPTSTPWWAAKAPHKTQGFFFFGSSQQSSTWGTFIFKVKRRRAS